MNGPYLAQPNKQRYPWYTLNPRAIRMWRIFPFVILFLLLVLFNEKHLWCWDWQHGVNFRGNCRAVTIADGRQIEAWRWVEGREIRLYAADEMTLKATRFAARGVRDLVDELGLDLRVRVMPPPAYVTDALDRSTRRNNGVPTIDFERLSRELVAKRNGPYAEILYTSAKIDGERNVVGAAMFKYGVALLDARDSTVFTVRHETAHLLGYHMHDTFPLIVFGYSNPQWAIYQHDQGSNTVPLMIDCDNGYALSDRSRDALLHFWRGLENRTDERFFTTVMTAGTSRLAGAVPK
jgi:hypothetical protein